MAFATKYRFHLYGFYVGTYWKIDLQKDGYVGSINSSENLDAAAALVINLEGMGGEKYFTATGSRLKSTSATLQIFVDNATIKEELDEFATLTNASWKMLIYKGTASGNETIWAELMIQPDVYSHPYEDFPYFISITATDELGRLNAIPFDNSGTAYTARDSYMTYIMAILGKLNISRQVKSVCNVFASGMATDDPLWQATVDPTKYVNNAGRENEEVWNCADVLNDLLAAFGAVMLLGRGNAWTIRRINELAADSFQENTYSAASGVASSAAVSDHIISTNGNTDDSIMTFINSPMISVGWRWKRVGLRIFTGGNENFVFRGDLSPAYWTGLNSLLYWFEVNKGPSADPTVKYGATTPFPAVELIERVEIFEDVKYMGGVYINGDIPNSTIHTWLADQTFNDLILGTGTTDEIYSVDDEVFLMKANDAVMPVPLGDNRSYFIKQFTGGDFRYPQLSLTQGGAVIDLTSDGSGTRFIGLAATEQLTYAVQINGYQTAEYSSGDITNKNGIYTAGVWVLAGSGNTISISFFWRLIFDNADAFQSDAAYGYWQLTISTPGGTIYYYNKTTFAWQTTAVANVLEDDLKAYDWRHERVDSSTIPADGRMEFWIYQPSSASNTELLGMQVANIESSFTIGGVTDAEYIDKVCEVGEDFAYTADTIELYSGDLPSTAYKGYVGYGGALAVNWYRRGVSETKELTDILLQCMMNNCGRTSLKVSGNLMGDFVPDQIIEDSNLQYEREGGTVTPRLMLLGGSLNVEEGLWSGEWVEIVE